VTFRPQLAAVLLVVVVSACATQSGSPPASDSADAPSVAASPSASVTLEGPQLEPAVGRAWFGMNLDWGSRTVAEVSDDMGVTPAVWVQFVRFPLDDAARQHLTGFFEQVGAAGAHGLLTLEPHDGLDAVTRAAADELAAVLDAAWAEHGVATFVRFAHEMNGSWYPWGQQPDAYVDAFRLVADALRSRAPASAMIWAPNDGAGYPFTGGQFGATPESGGFASLDTDGDGALTRDDDPYAPYWPGDDVVDWVGMSLYFWGLDYPWGENEVPAPGRFAAQLTGVPTGAHDDEVVVPNFYATYAEGHDKPMAITETAAFFDPAGRGPTEAEVKSAWFRQVFSVETRDRFERVGMVNWFEWHKHEPEVGREIDWRLTADPSLARALLDEVPGGWLAFAPIGGDQPGD
jgi:hypothetical protein